jgi:hypothetical protein
MKRELKIKDLNLIGFKPDELIRPAPIEAILRQSYRHEIAPFLATAGSFHSDESLYQGEGGQIIIQIRMFLICEFWREIVDSKFQFCKNLPALRNSEWFKAEVELWVKVFRMLERMNSLEKLPVLDIPFPNSIGTFFCLLIRENGLIMPWFGSFGQTNTTSFIKELQRQNRMMTSDQNPFQGTHAMTSELVIRNAIKLAASSDCFRGQFFTPMVKARGTLAQAMRKKGHDYYKVTSSGELETVFRRNNPKKSGF